jgi:hypothetical protein
MRFESVDWIYLDQDRGPWHFIVYTGMALLCSTEDGLFFDLLSDFWLFKKILCLVDC